MAKHEVCLLRFLGDNRLVVSTSVVQDIDHTLSQTVESTFPKAQLRVVFTSKPAYLKGLQRMFCRLPLKAMHDIQVHVQLWEDVYRSNNPVSRRTHQAARPSFLVGRPIGAEEGGRGFSDSSPPQNEQCMYSEGTAS